MFLEFLYTFFHSLGGNTIEDSGASALADTLKVNQILKTLKYVTIKCKPN